MIATTALGVIHVRADDTNAPWPPPMRPQLAATNAPVAAWTTNAPTMEQRLESIEAYFQNGDPTAPYKDTNGNWTVNFGLGAVTSSTPT